MVPRKGCAQRDKSGQSNVLIRLSVRTAKWCIARICVSIQFFKDIGLKDAEHRLVLELAGLTERDELVWEFCDDGVEVFEASRNDIPFRLEISRSGPVLLTKHGDIKSRIIKGSILDILVQNIFKQEVRFHRREETTSFDPDREFKEVLSGRYKEFLKRRP